MSQRPFRFLHASDLHLDLPLSGMAVVAAHLRPTMLAAASAACEQLVDTALAENVDFVVLAGDVIQADLAGPRLLAQWYTQLDRLAEANIAVYWASGEVDQLSQWPSAIRLPANVHRFAAGPVTRLKHQRDDRPLVELVGTSQQHDKHIQPKDYLSDTTALPRVVVAYGTVDAKKLEKQLAAQDSPSYWALGGQHTRETVLSGKHIAHYSGTHQGRSPQEQGPHGATLIDFDPNGVFHTSFVETDVLRWCDETVEVDRLTTADQLEKMLRQRLDSLLQLNPSQTLMVTCRVASSTVGEAIPSCALLNELGTSSLASDLVELLQVDYGHRNPPLWVSELSLAQAAAADQPQVSQDTILGDYLQTLTAFERGEQSLDFEPLLPDHKTLALLAADLELTQPSDLAAVLAAARARGLALLGGEADSIQALVAEGTQS